MQGAIMANIGATQFLERIQFFNGERLFATDLQALESFNREMWQLHCQSLHRPGIGSGFAVVGNVGDRQVTISPGYALDCCGRQIILTETQVQQIPPVADNGSGGSVFYDLTVSYPDDTELKPSETREGICTTAGVVRLREAPVFCWVRLNDDPTNPQPVDVTPKTRIKNNLFIVLARIEIFNCQLKQPVSTALRIDARPATQPRIAAGIETQSKWEKNSYTESGAAMTSGGLFAPDYYSRAIDTSGAGFQATPNYMVRIVGGRLISKDRSYFVGDAVITISNDPKNAPTPRGFTVQIFPVIAALSLLGGEAMAAPTRRSSASAATLADQFIKQWDVAWIGIEG
jgi:hypothetical protein